LFGLICCLGLVLVWAECLEYISDTGAQFARHASVKDALSLSLSLGARRASMAPRRKGVIRKQTRKKAARTACLFSFAYYDVLNLKLCVLECVRRVRPNRDSLSSLLWLNLATESKRSSTSCRHSTTSEYIFMRHMLFILICECYYIFR
jgi:hypothetical protein